MTNATLWGKPSAGRSHVWFDEGAKILASGLIVGLCGTLFGYDTTGYVIGNAGGSNAKNDSPILVPSHWTWPGGEPPATMDPDAKYYTKVGTSYFYLDHDVTAPGAEWVLDRRSTAAGKYSIFQFSSKYSNTARVTFPNLIVNDGGTRFQTWTASCGGVAGQMTVRATKDDPFQIVYDVADEGSFPFSNLTLLGDENAGVELCGPADNRSAYTTGKVTFQTCDLTGFAGRIRVRMLRDAPVPENVYMSFCPGAMTCPGELLCEAGGAISLADATGAVTFGTVTFEDGARLQGIGPGRALTVTDALSVVGKLIIDFSGSTVSDAADAWTIFSCGPNVDVSGVDTSNFVFVNAPQREKIDLIHMSYFMWFDEAGGGKALKLVLPKIVTRENVTSTPDRSDFEYATATDSGADYYWSHQGAPGLDADAADVIYLEKDKASSVPMPPPGADVYEFPGRVLILSGNNAGPVFNLRDGKAGLKADILSVGACLIAQKGKLDKDASKLGYCDPETGDEFWTCLLRGTLNVCPGSKPAELRSTYGIQRQLRVESTISGSGNITFSAVQNKTPAYASTNAGTLELTADNSDFSGKMAVTEDYMAVGGTSDRTPDAMNNIRLIVSDGKALGGARDEFAFDALFLEHYSRLMVRDDVTLAAGLNRGVAIGDHANFWVPEAKALTVNQPLNLCGELTKTGAGTLVLGGTAMTFGADGESEIPIANSNRLTVAAGALRVTNAAAADGAAIVLAEGAKLLVGLDDTAETALRSVKAGSSLTAVDGAIPVAFDTGDREPAAFSTVICTSGDATLRFACAKPWKGFGVKVTADTVGTVTTYTASAERMGLILLLK